MIGPCNVEFREFRQFVHDSKQYRDKEMPLGLQESMHEIVGRFLFCARQHPVYYHSLLNKKSDPEDEDVEVGEFEEKEEIKEESKEKME